MEHLTAETVTYILWDIALGEILLVVAMLFKVSGHHIIEWLVTDEKPKKVEPKKIEPPRVETKQTEETIIEIDGIQ